jgi:hypothetical protein
VGKSPANLFSLVVLNAGLGDMPLGLQMEGFQVIAAYERI